MNEKCRLNIWREGKYEVDFVKQKNDEMSSIDVKCGAKHSASGMNAFKKKYQQTINARI